MATSLLWREVEVLMGHLCPHGLVVERKQLWAMIVDETKQDIVQPTTASIQLRTLADKPRGGN
jgi:hypothetical protein